MKSLVGGNSLAARFDALPEVPLRDALQAETSLKKIFRMLYFDVIGLGPQRAVGAEMPLLTVRIPAVCTDFHTPNQPRKVASSDM
jgi:hypothetical protein